MDMDVKRDRKVAGIVGGTLVVATTAFFVMFRPVGFHLVYWFNFAFSIILEILFSCLFVWGRKHNLSVPFYIASWVYVCLFLLLCVCTMGVYFALAEPGIIPMAIKSAYPDVQVPLSGVFSGMASTFGEGGGLGRNLYFSVFIAITAIWIIVMAVLWHTDVAYTESVHELNRVSSLIVDFSEQCELLNKKYQRVCAEKGILLESRSNRRNVLDKLVDKLRFLTPNVLHNQMVQVRLMELLCDCKDIIVETEEAENEDMDRLVRKMNSFVADAVDEIDFLRKSSLTQIK